MRNVGLSNTDVKTYKSLAGISYTSLFALTGTINSLTTDYQLMSPSTVISPLPQHRLTSASKVKIASTSTGDSVADVGARVCNIIGLGENYNVQEELVLMDGQTAVETNNTWIRVFEAVIVQYGSNTNAFGDSVSVGDIYVGTGAFASGIPANAMVSIIASQGEPGSREAIFTVPDGKYLLLKSMFCGCDPDKKENYSLIVQIAISVFGVGGNLWFKFPPMYFDGIMQYIPEFNAIIPPRADIQVRVKSTTSKTKSSFVILDFEMKDAR